MNIDFSKITFIEIIDVLLVGILLFLVLKILKGSIARNVFIGYLIIYGTYLIVILLRMKFLTIILGEFIRWGVLGLFIIFQQEIRRFLQMIGQSASFQNNSFLRKFYKPLRRAESPTTLQAIIEATKAMATAHVGALIVIHKDNDLSRFIESGDEIDSLISKRLIISIFSKNSPLHDGAIIIQNDRIRSVRCSLPISESGTISPTLGFRHRAAIGMSEHTDAAIIVISEENGEMSLVYTGHIIRKLTISELESQLTNYFSK